MNIHGITTNVPICGRRTSNVIGGRLEDSEMRDKHRWVQRMKSLNVLCFEGMKCKILFCNSEHKILKESVTSQQNIAKFLKDSNILLEDRTLHGHTILIIKLRSL